MELSFEIVTAGVWQAVEHPEIQVRKKGPNLLAKDSRALRGWAVFCNGIEVLTCGRSATKREAQAEAERFMDRAAEQQARMTVEADRQLVSNTPEGQAARMSPPAPIAEALDRVSAAAREAVEAAIAAAEDRPDPATTDDFADLVDRMVRRAQYLALRAVLDSLDGWIEGDKANHDAMEHRNENTGSECWTNYHPDDVRTMVQDAARDLGLTAPLFVKAAS